MCVVSMIMDHQRSLWDQIPKPNTPSGLDNLLKPKEPPITDKEIKNNPDFKGASIDQKEKAVAKVWEELE